MSVANGQIANQTTFNDSFMSREVDTDTIGKVDLENVAAESGPSLINVQRFCNSIASALGMSTAEVYNFLFTYSSNMVGAANDTVKARLEALVAKFAGSSSHNHSGVDGQGEKISAANLLNINPYFAEWQSISITGVSGSSTDVSGAMSGRSPNGSTGSVGVITAGAFRKVTLVDPLTGGGFEDAQGQRVYGYLEYSAPNWTIDFYTLENGVETVYGGFVSPVDMTVFFREVFDLNTRPTIPTSPDFGTLDTTSDVVDASDLNRGVVNTIAQPFAGKKHFTEGARLSYQLEVDSETDSAASGLNAVLVFEQIVKVVDNAIISIAGIEAPAGANFVVLINKTNAEINLMHDDPSVAIATKRIYTWNGVPIPLAYNMAYVFIYDPVASRWVLAGSSRQTEIVMVDAGGTPNSRGFSYSFPYGDFQLHPADATNPGVVMPDAQEFGGDKTFKDALIADRALKCSMNDDASNGNMTALDSSLAPIIRLTGNPTNLSGITPPSDGNQLLIIVNKSNDTVQVNNEAPSATAAYRILTGTGDPVTLANNASLFFVYSFTDQRWHIIGGTGGGGSDGKRPAIITTTNYNVQITDSIILVDNQFNDVTVTLPSLASANERTYTVHKRSALNRIKIVMDGAGSFDGSGISEIYLDVENESVSLYACNAISSYMRI